MTFVYFASSNENKFLEIQSLFEMENKENKENKENRKENKE